MIQKFLVGAPEPTGKLKDIINDLSKSYGEALEPFLKHLSGGTSAEWLADTLTEAGYPIGATTIKSYRRKLRAVANEGSVKL